MPETSETTEIVVLEGDELATFDSLGTCGGKIAPSPDEQLENTEN